MWKPRQIRQIPSEVLLIKSEWGGNKRPEQFKNVRRNYIFNKLFSLKEKTSSLVLQENAIIILKNKSLQLPKNVPKE